MHSHIGVGVGKYIEEEFEKTKNSLWLASPIITPNIAKKLINVAKNGIKIRIITSSRITEESEQANIIISKFCKEKIKDKSEPGINIKTINHNEVPMIHAKIFIFDQKTVIMGSVNLTEKHFWEYAEYIWVIDESEYVEQTIKDYETLWSSYSHSEIDLNETKRKSKNLVRRLKRKITKIV